MPIEIKKLTHVYMSGSPFESIAIHEVDLTIRDGELLGLIGHTGSGKSTLVQHLNGLLKPTSGEIWVDGVSITQKGRSLQWLRQKVGLAFQYPEYQLFEETVEKDIAFGPKNMGLTGDALAERVTKAMRRANVPESMRERSPFELSGGEKRRVAIAGVLALEPSTLILDEPTAGLDPRGRRDMLALIEDLKRDGTSIVLVSHSMEDIAELADRIAVMDKGKLALLDTPEAIFQKREQLEAIGLGVPQAVRLADKLRADGFPLPPLITLAQLSEALVPLLKGGQRHA